MECGLMQSTWRCQTQPSLYDRESKFFSNWLLSSLKLVTSLSELNNIHSDKQVTEVLNFAVRQVSVIEANIVSVERVKEYQETPNEVSEWFIFLLFPCKLNRELLPKWNYRALQVLKNNEIVFSRYIYIKEWVKVDIYNGFIFYLILSTSRRTRN